MRARTPAPVTLADVLVDVEAWARGAVDRAAADRARATAQDRYLRGLADGQTVTAEALLEVVVRLRRDVDARTEAPR